jgi:hypothetical protein
MDHRAERFAREGLVEERHGPCLKGALAHAPLEAGGHHDHRRPPVEADGLELPDNLATVYFRHQHVQDNPVVPRTLQLLERLAAAGGGLDVEPIGDQDHSLKSQDVFLIFDHKKLHARPPEGQASLPRSPSLTSSLSRTARREPNWNWQRAQVPRALPRSRARGRVGGVPRIKGDDQIGVSPALPVGRSYGTAHAGHWHAQWAMQSERLCRHW